MGKEELDARLSALDESIRIFQMNYPAMGETDAFDTGYLKRIDAGIIVDEIRRLFGKITEQFSEIDGLFAQGFTNQYVLSAIAERFETVESLQRLEQEFIETLLK